MSSLSQHPALPEHAAMWAARVFRPPPLLSMLPLYRGVSGGDRRWLGRSSYALAPAVRRNRTSGGTKSCHIARMMLAALPPKPVAFTMTDRIGLDERGL
jgi:hypothetical protein